MSAGSFCRKFRRFWRLLKEDLRKNEVLTKIIAFGCLVLLAILAVGFFGVFGSLVLSIVIIVTKYLSFSVDFTLDNVGEAAFTGSFAIMIGVLIIGLLDFLRTYFGGLWKKADANTLAEQLLG